MKAMDQPRQGGKFAPKVTELKGDAIAFRLPLSLDVQVRKKAGWHDKSDNYLLHAWIQAACESAVALPPAVTVASSLTTDQVRAAADRVARSIRPRDRAPIIKAMNALIGELLAEGGE